MSDFLTLKYNQCLAENYFPLAVKLPKVNPLIKGGSNYNTHLGNYGPISLLSSLGKSLEKHIHTCIILDCFTF